MLGQEWPEADTSFAIFIPVDSARKPSWAFGLKKGSWYVGGGYRLKLPSAAAKDIKAVVNDFEGTLSDVGGGQDVCSLVSQAAAANDNWSVVGRYEGETEGRSRDLRSDSLRYRGRDPAVRRASNEPFPAVRAWIDFPGMNTSALKPTGCPQSVTLPTIRPTRPTA